MSRSLSSLSRLAVAAVLAPAAALLVPPALPAQTPADTTLPAGSRVRVTAPEAGLDGAVVELAAGSRDALTVTAGPERRSLRIERAAVEALAVSRGREGHPWLGLGIGLVGVGGTAAGIAYASEEFPHRGRAAGLVGQPAALGGALLGGLVGLAVRTEQ